MGEKLTIAHSITLCKILENILFSQGENGVKENELPFNVRYKIQRNLDLLSKDRGYFEYEKSRLINLYGEENKDNPGMIEVKPENKETYKNEMIKVLSIEVSHNLKKLKPEEVECIKNVKAQAFEMDLFIALMVEDPDFVEDLNTKVVSEKTETTE